VACDTISKPCGRRLPTLQAGSALEDHPDVATGEDGRLTVRPQIDQRRRDLLAVDREDARLSAITDVGIPCLSLATVGCGGLQIRHVVGVAAQDAGMQRRYSQM
jgi:hypothetical protein